ncbi:uncharacterized protein LOC116106631 [Pistacia vera]|uniref:uncharacterized protein LOC116106631 n=1 Tax=Pistacia vera TaxID=55513 RepID=UPI001263C20D|nr:uncharacterized protein LOC116106631 [Pistacia vera]
MRKTRRTDPGRSDASNAQDVPTAPKTSNPTTATSSAPGLDVATLERMIQEAINRALRRTPPKSTGTPVTTVTTNVPPEFSGTNDLVVVEQWIKLVEKATALFPMTDQEKIRYATYLLRGDAMTWWELMEQTQDTTTLTWSGFKELFEEQYRTADMMSSKLQEFISLQQGNMMVKEYSIKFNSLAKFAPTLVSTPQTRLERFVGGLHTTIAGDVMSSHQPSQTYSKALSKAIRAKVYLRKETRLALPPIMAKACEQSFQELKKRLTTAPILTLSEVGIDYDIYVDASHNGLGAVLMQQGKVIAYASRQLKDYESKYPTHDLELVAVVFALKIWRHYLYGVKWNIYTDHKSLKYFFTQKELNDLELAAVVFALKIWRHYLYHPGKANAVADALSRKVSLSQITVQGQLQQEILQEGIEIVIKGGLAQMEIKPTLVEEIKMKQDKIDVFQLGQLYVREIVRLHGVPKTIVSDRDTRFISAFWVGMQRALGTKLAFSMAYHP